MLTGIIVHMGQEKRNSHVVSGDNRSGLMVKVSFLVTK